MTVLVAGKMTPSIGDYFKSFYYSNSYVAPVDLSVRALRAHHLSATDSDAARIARNLISDPDVQRTLSAAPKNLYKSVHCIETLAKQFC